MRWTKNSRALERVCKVGYKARQLIKPLVFLEFFERLQCAIDCGSVGLCIDFAVLATLFQFFSNFFGILWTTSSDEEEMAGLSWIILSLFAFVTQGQFKDFCAPIQGSCNHCFALQTANNGFEQQLLNLPHKRTELVRS